MTTIASVAALVCTLATAGAALAADGGRSNDPTLFDFPINAGWHLDRSMGTDDLLPAPGGGPGPVTFDKVHPYIAPTAPGSQTTYRVADLSNPILQDWLKPSMKRANDNVLAGGVAFRPRERCWPAGVPLFDAESWVDHFYIYRHGNEILAAWPGGPDIRRIYLDVPHSKNVKPSWSGESVAHIENGDTLVIDTIGLSSRTFVDHYRTPHTDKLHVIERWKLSPDKQKIDVSIRVEDPGAFTTPWQATLHWTRFQTAPFEAQTCAENNGDFFGQGLIPIPSAETADF